MSKEWRIITTERDWLADRLIPFLKNIGDGADRIEKMWFQSKQAGLMAMFGDDQNNLVGGVFLGLYTEDDPLYIPNHLLPREIIPPMRSHVQIDDQFGVPCTILRYYWRSDRVTVALDEPCVSRHEKWNGQTIISTWRQRTIANREEEEEEW